ncbi:hsp90-like protein [Colletotrichum navitas]|uniref:histidine kinase n=1 Tax=Colletotrichum navitas TaxID=681940 RepID=A0AAD8V4T5_9PEZI|nr:hsp90-like protein [Colletotrichum navitas]KAK1589684.1 hsp90-like protein [Colletotrichum navitas]
MGVRIAIREQLAFLVVVAVLLGLMILSVPVWIYVNKFVTEVEGRELALTASLKASRVSAELELLQSSIVTISSRILIQNSLFDFYGGNDTEGNWAQAKDDLNSALSVGGLNGLLQGRIYSRNTTGNVHGLLNVTGEGIPRIPLPYGGSNGQPAYLSDTPEGYLTALYPNITYTDLGRPNQYRNNTQAFAAFAFPGVRITANGGLLLGPVVINETTALMSITVPIRYNLQPDFVLGYMTLVATANSLISIRNSREGLGSTGIVLLVGPTTQSNRFPSDQAVSNATYLPDSRKIGEVPVKFVLPPNPLSGQADRHSKRSSANSQDDKPFPMKSYPAVFDSFAKRFASPNNSSSVLSTKNEQGYPVAVGFARTNTALVNWTVVVEQAKSEVDQPIDTLRNIMLGCVFGTAGLVIILIFPCAHLSVKPIRRLKTATEKSVQPPGYEDGYYSDLDGGTPCSGGLSSRSKRSRKDGFIASIYQLVRYKHREKVASDHDRDSTRRIFKIPGKVENRKHFITDELTELTETFNDMSDELFKQYTSLDQKVLERTRELEISKKAAEAANESKTLFIANISHELKTPLNGILGMCAVCMEENDILRIKQSLKTLYKSGDLLLHLLEDLLSFSKNQIGQQLNLEEREFRLADIKSQILTIFDKQVKEGRITLTVNFLALEAIELGSPERTSTDNRLPALGPHGTGRLKDMCLWGDQHRILQVIINLVSNSVKFTPAGGRVDVRIKCIGEVETPPANDGSRSSSFSKDSRRHSRPRHRLGSNSSQSVISKGGSTSEPVKGTALVINPMEPKSTPHIYVQERSPTPPPPGAKAYLFEFEVEDTGPGIAEHMQQKVFEPFVQGDLGLSKKYGGTGLGLSICHQLATLMGGSISLKSTVGVGTTFTMQIPLKYVKNKASSTASSSVNSRTPSVDAIDKIESTQNSKRNSGGTPVKPPIKPANETNAKNLLDQQPRLVGLSQPFFASNPAPKGKRNSRDQMAVIDKAMATKANPEVKLRVLVADDNSTNIEVVSKMLKLEEVYDVTVAKDGQEAYDLVKANMDNNKGFDVIFMDVQMPNLDGLQSTKLIRKMGYTAPIVALTAFSEESNVRECMESGMNEFLSKPIRRPALKQVLKKFATIPEEPETTSLTRKTTPERATSEKLKEANSGTAPELNEKGDAIHPNGNGNGNAIAAASEQPLSEKGA